MSEDANVELVRRLLAAFEAGDESVVDELIHPAHRDHGAPDRPAGPDGVRAAIRWVRETFGEPTDRARGHHRQRGSVFARIRVSAVGIGDVCGIAAAGCRLEVEHVHIWRVAGCRLVEHWTVRDDLGALRQLGAAPVIAPASNHQPAKGPTCTY